MVFMAKQKTDEYGNFESLLKKVVSVPHSVIKAKLDAEKKAKGQKSKRSSGPRASGATRHGNA
jgi:hypothetical protein